MDYYFQQLTGEHDYTMLNSLKFIQQLIDAQSGDNSSDYAFFQRLDNAYTFKATVTLNDQG